MEGWCAGDSLGMMICGQTEEYHVAEVQTEQNSFQGQSWNSRNWGGFIVPSLRTPLRFHNCILTFAFCSLLWHVSSPRDENKKSFLFIPSVCHSDWHILESSIKTPRTNKCSLDSKVKRTTQVFQKWSRTLQVLPFASANRCPQGDRRVKNSLDRRAGLDHDPPDMSIFRKTKSERNEKRNRDKLGTGSGIKFLLPFLLSYLN